MARRLNRNRASGLARYPTGCLARGTVRVNDRVGRARILIIGWIQMESDDRAGIVYRGADVDGRLGR